MLRAWSRLCDDNDHKNDGIVIQIGAPLSAASNIRNVLDEIQERVQMLGVARHVFLDPLDDGSEDLELAGVRHKDVALEQRQQVVVLELLQDTLDVHLLELLPDQLEARFQQPAMRTIMNLSRKCQFREGNEKPVHD